MIKNPFIQLFIHTYFKMIPYNVHDLEWPLPYRALSKVSRERLFFRKTHKDVGRYLRQEEAGDFSNTFCLNTRGWTFRRKLCPIWPPPPRQKKRHTPLCGRRWWKEHFRKLWKNPHPESIRLPRIENGILLSGKSTNSSLQVWLLWSEAHEGLEGRLIWKADKPGPKTDSPNIIIEVPPSSHLKLPNMHAVHSEYTVWRDCKRFQAQFVFRFYSLHTELCAAKHFQKTVKT